MIPIQDQPQIASIAVFTVFITLCTTAVVLRTFSRWIQYRSLSSSDYCIFGALFLNYAFYACAMINIVVGGVGIHANEVTIPELTIFLKSLYAIQLLWAGAEGLLKTSMCLLYIEIFRLKSFRIAAYIVIAVSNAFAATVVLATTFICSPIPFSWDPTITGTCGNRNALWLAIGVLNIVTDVLVLALPMPMLWRLQIPQKKKIALSLIFGLGFFVCIVSMIRLKYLLQVDFTGDITYTVVDAIIWSFLEPTLGVTIGCMPTLGPLVHRVTPHMFGTTPKPQGYDKPAANKHFHQLSDQAFPLTSNSISGADGQKTAHDTGSREDVREINIMTEWEVSHSSS